MEKNQVFKFFCLKTCSVLDTIDYEKRSQESSVLRNVFRLSLVMEIDKQGGQVLQLRTDKMEYGMFIIDIQGVSRVLRFK